MKYASIGFAMGMALALAGGCGTSHSTTPPQTDAGITFDAAPPPDTGPDSGYDASALPGPSDVGSMCTMASDCSGGFCLDEMNEGFPGGYCSEICGAGGSSCPDGSSCIQLSGMTSACLDDCDPAATTRQCRAGYGCDGDFMLPHPVCIPGCTDDTDCASGHMCDTSGGTGGACYDPSASVGDACLGDSNCPAGGFCYAERFSGWPGGACVVFGCDVAANAGCPDGSVCEPGGFGGNGLCIQSCTMDSDCRANYACKANSAYPDRTYCAPACTDDSQCASGTVCNPALGTCDVPFNPSDLGQTCNRRSCNGGTCLDEQSTGFPASYCSYLGCDPTAPDASDGCPGTGVCFALGGTDLCLAACTTDSDCRDGYGCRHRDPADTTSPMACMAQCTMNAQCTTTGDICNPGVGACTQPFVASNLGQACASASDCVGGRCFDEASAGWPGGTCAAVGCSLSGSSTAETCPSGGVCVDNGEAPADIGVCLTACDPSASGTCRTGYACVPLPSDATMGACKPACTGDSDCSGGRTCDTGTGMCS